MPQSSPGAADLARDALAALRGGDAARARPLFARLVATDPANGDGWLGLAFACARLGDDPATLAAVDRALDIDPRNLRALLFKADHFAATGRRGPALGFYRAAIRVAESAGTLAADVAQGMRRAVEAVERFSGEVEVRLFEGLRSRGFDPAHCSPRFATSLDISLGRKQVFHQSPTRYYFPGLPQQQFYPRAGFAWAGSVECRAGEIRDELRALLQEPSAFAPYLQSSSETPALNDRSQLDNPDWSACYLLRDGAPQDAAARCPRTLEALARAPLPRIPGRSPNVLFSKLAPRTRIPPHNGFLNTRLICHLPLLVPANCGALRCGNEQREWREGELLVFDDSIEHEAWNDSDAERVVLLFEIWRPELDDEERALVSALLELSGQYSE